MDYITCWDTQIIVLEQQSIWFNYNVRTLRYLDFLANSYLSNCVKNMLRRNNNEHKSRRQGSH